MPAGNQTGPWGLGPGTGRGLGYCSGFQAPGHMFPGPGPGFGRGLGFAKGFGRGLGCGFGAGRGGGLRARWFNPSWRHPHDPWGAAEVAPKQEIDLLRAEARQVREELKAIEQRIQDLEREEK
jgi:hypothetical protein